MYECPGCGANMKFDISSQQMSCAFCGRQADPYSLQKEEDAVLSDTFEAAVFTCPQCGGEMISGDQDATAFCSFCGAANILTSRLVREKRPGYIIPFKKTREDCRKAYARKMRWALFMPKELRNPAHIDSFRGIYMPYWTYQMEQKGDIWFKGSKSYRRGDYVYTEYYDLIGKVDADYYGFSYDASTTFYDSISEALAPYYVKDQVEFTPAYLSGFYADIADVDQNLYLEKAQTMANESSWAQVCSTKAFRKYNIDRDVNRFNLTDKLHTRCTAAHSTMYPVWFLSWRKDDRVAYATVNGQTGKVVADLPIDIGQFIKMALVLAIPLFILLNLLGTMKPLLLLIFCSLLGVAAAWIYLRELRAIRRREGNESDIALQQKSEKQWQGENWADNYRQRKQKVPRKRSGVYKRLALMLILQFAVPIFICMSMTISLAQRTQLYVPLGDTVLKSVSAIWPFTAMIVCAVLYYKSYREEKSLENYRHRYSGLTAIGAQIAAVIICYLHPVSDLWYYLGAVLIMLSVLYDILDILRGYNRLAMRRLPQFDKQGGDNHA